MTSEKDVPFGKSMILSLDSPEVENLKYRIGEKFLLRQESMKDLTWDVDMREALDGQHVIIEIRSYEIDIDGTLGYALSFISPEYDWKWWVPEEILDTDFIYVGKNFEQARFVLIFNDD